jgi:hypothetical protein
MCVARWCVHATYSDAIHGAAHPKNHDNPVSNLVVNDWHERSEITAVLAHPIHSAVHQWHQHDNKRDVQPSPLCIE